MLPFIGHMGVCLTNGLILDFAGEDNCSSEHDLTYSASSDGQIYKVVPSNRTQLFCGLS